MSRLLSSSQSSHQTKRYWSKNGVLPRILDLGQLQERIQIPIPWSRQECKSLRLPKIPSPNKLAFSQMPPPSSQIPSPSSQAPSQHTTWSEHLLRLNLKIFFSEPLYHQNKTSSLLQSFLRNGRMAIGNP